MTVVLLGGSGVLGSGCRQALTANGQPFLHLRPPWHSVQSLDDWFARSLPAAVAQGAEPPDDLRVVWAAGIGSVGAGPEVLRRETVGLAGLAAAVRQLPEPLRLRTSVAFSSSAGALFADGASGVLHEASPPAPSSAYGHEKLVQESLLERMAEETGCRVVSCRISNLFGLAAQGVTSRGLVAAAVRSARLRRPLTVFVSPDTRRDYLYNVDAAHICLRLLAAAPRGWSTALVTDGRTRSVTEVLTTVGRVAGRRVPVNYAERAETRLQPRALRFHRPDGPLAGGRRTPFEVAVAAMLRAPLSA